MRGLTMDLTIVSPFITTQKVFPTFFDGLFVSLQILVCIYFRKAFDAAFASMGEKNWETVCRVLEEYLEKQP